MSASGAGDGDRSRLSRLGLAEFEALAGEWDALVGARDGPFVTAAWLAAWWRAFAADEGVALALFDGDRLVAGGCFCEPRGAGTLTSAANEHSGDWDVVAVDEQAAERFWRELLAAQRYRRLRADSVPGGHGHAEALRGALARGRYRLAEEPQPPSPWLELPASLDELLQARSRNLRSQVGRRTRALEREGALAFRTTTGGPRLEHDVERFFELEASGWKSESGTAIALDPALASLYTDFAAAASEAGWLRLHLLELDGEPIAGDYGVVHGGCGYLIKTGFREDLGRFAPGLVLRAEVLRASIEEGLDRYDFLGGPDAYKLRWTDDVRRRSTLRGFRGIGAAPAWAWWSGARPALKRARAAARALPRAGK